MCGEREIERERERERERRTRKSVTKEEEEGTSIASDVVKVEGEDPATPGDYPRSVDTRIESESERMRERGSIAKTPLGGHILQNTAEPTGQRGDTRT